MMSIRFHIVTVLAVFVTAGLWQPAGVHADIPEPADAPVLEDIPQFAETPEAPQVSPLVRRLLDDPITSEAERRSLKVFHGQWDELEEPQPSEQAMIALIRFDLLDDALDDETVPPLIRARAALHRGEPQRVLQLLEQPATIEAALWRARAYEMLGQSDRAVALLEPIREQLDRLPLPQASERTAAAEAILMLAHLQGRPSRDYHTALNMLASVRDQIDPLYWPAHLAEARLLIDKDNRAQGAEALMEVLALNPQCAQAWYELGLLHVGGFDFTRAGVIEQMLRNISQDSLLADLLAIRSFLQQRDVESAAMLIEDALRQYPHNRDLLAMHCAAAALVYDEDKLRERLDHFEQLSPRSPQAYYIVGRVLSAARQYDWSGRMLRQAINRQPNWPAPRIELGLMLMQADDDQLAHRELTQATRLDPFNVRASNQLKLVEELLGYARIETENFIIKYKKDTVDEVLARDMPEELERIYEEVTERFQYQPERKTHIDIMPNEQWFAVRITGMPEIWTIAACTGDVISLTPPRLGSRQSGPYYWSNVLRHEYVHTVTLAQTLNRVPHWFTEACAVSEEVTGRDYNTYRMLAEALQNDELFSLDRINWGFVRPRTPRDRPLAYAQSHWMLQYIEESAGWQAVVDMLNLFREGISDVKAFELVLQQSPEQFMSGFEVWAMDQVRQWGLDERPASERLEQILANEDEVASIEEVMQLLEEHPDHPDLLEAVARRAVEVEDVETARQWVENYHRARPVDPWPHEAMVQLAAKENNLPKAIPAMVELDRRENRSGMWAHQLAQLHRQADELDDAAHFIRRALLREPYNARYRELAATIALQNQNMEHAIHQLESLALLEPDRAQHHIRLAALYTRMEKFNEADAAARNALEIDPDAPVERFLHN